MTEINLSRNHSVTIHLPFSQLKREISPYEYRTCWLQFYKGVIMKLSIVYIFYSMKDLLICTEVNSSDKKTKHCRVSDTSVSVTRPWTYWFVIFCKGGRGRLYLWAEWILQLWSFIYPDIFKCYVLKGNKFICHYIKIKDLKKVYYVSQKEKQKNVKRKLSFFKGMFCVKKNIWCNRFLRYFLV